MNTNPRRQAPVVTACRIGPTAVCLALLTLAPGALIAQGHATPPPEAASTTVKIDDLDLTTPEGVRTAHSRLGAAAIHLCYRFSDTRRVSNMATLEDCVNDALDDALDRLNKQQLVASARETHTKQGGARGR